MNNKYDLIAEEIKWCEAHRNPEQMVYQDGFIAGLQHALFLMRSRPTKDVADGFTADGCGCIPALNIVCPVHAAISIRRR